MIRFVDDPTEPAWCGYMYAALMFVVAFVQSLIQHQFMHRCMTTGMRMRTALITSIYKKVCRVLSLQTLLERLPLDYATFRRLPIIIIY